MNGALEEVGHERVEPVTLHDNHFVNLCFEGFGLAQLRKERLDVFEYLSKRVFLSGDRHSAYLSGRSGEKEET